MSKSSVSGVRNASAPTVFFRSLKLSCMYPIPVTKVWHRVGIDLVGPLPETKQGNKYIIALNDYFSKWPEATLTAIPTKEATCVARFLLDVFCQHGWPKLECTGLTNVPSGDWFCSECS